MIPISGKDIRKQLKYDLIGKDSYRGVTLSYTWLANQFGHFSLGFIPTFIIYKLLARYSCAMHPAILAAAIVAISWLLFETYNCLGSIVWVPKKAYTFQPDWPNIIYDTITDLCFFWIGTSFASVLCNANCFILIVFILLALLMGYPSRDWYVTKMYQQAADYPFQFRLSQWEMPISESNKKTTLQFLKALESKTTGNHLLVFGSYKSGKTSLGVAIANELSIQHNSCSYVTAMKLFGLFSEPDLPTDDSSVNLWTWREPSLLIIDDINPGPPIREELVSPAIFYKSLGDGEQGEKNKKTLCEKNVIWILGNDELTYKHRQQEWAAMLGKIGVTPNNVKMVNLFTSN